MQRYYDLKGEDRVWFRVDDFGSTHRTLISTELCLSGIIYVDFSLYTLQIFSLGTEDIPRSPCLWKTFFVVFFPPQKNFVFSLGVHLRAVGVEEQQYKQWGAGAGSACQSGCSSRRLLEVSASPAPATLPQVQYLPGQGRTVWGLHAERPASFTCSGERIALYLVSSFKRAWFTHNYGLILWILEFLNSKKHDI